jgi:hypothetical protein
LQKKAKEFRNNQADQNVSAESYIANADQAPLKKKKKSSKSD